MNRKLYLVLVGVILFITVFLLVGHFKTYRYARLTFDESERPTFAHAEDFKVVAHGGYLKEESPLLFRAYVPDVSIQITADSDNDSIVLEVENIHPDSSLLATDKNINVKESQSGLARQIKLSGLERNQSVTLSWSFPKKSAYQFMAIGDTGGGQELSWSLIRAQQLNADFILHLGDAYYDEPDVGGFSTRLNASSVPVYVANGNHDFRGPEGNSIDVFLKNVGPMNTQFSLLGHCFINLDTGAYMYPPHKGGRAKILAAELVNQAQHPERCTENIVFTHKPVLGPFVAEFAQRTHSLNGYQARPLINQLKQLDNVTMLVGHIHQDFSFEQDGIKTYVSGNGLAQTDLIEGRPSAKVLLGKISTSEPLQFVWHENQMPVQYHCSQRVMSSLVGSGNANAQIVREACFKE